MSTRRTCRTDDELLGVFGSHTARVAADLREQIIRNRETVQVLREHLRSRGMTAAAQGPVVLSDPTPECVRDARDYARRTAAEQHVDDDRRDVLELAVSELVGNAVRHGRPPVSYEITRDGEDLLLLVRDAGAGEPGIGEDCGPDCESGRGLFLIAQMARAWGHDAPSSGTTIWVRV